MSKPLARGINTKSYYITLHLYRCKFKQRWSVWICFRKSRLKPRMLKSNYMNIKAHYCCEQKHAIANQLPIYTETSFLLFGLLWWRTSGGKTYFHLAFVHQAKIQNVLQNNLITVLSRLFQGNKIIVFGTTDVKLRPRCAVN